MNLVIDIGNTRIKAALFNANTLIERHVFETPDQLLNDMVLIKKAKQAIIGSVVNDLDVFFKKLNALVPTLLFTSDTKIPIENLYNTTSTLGSDRLAVAIGGFQSHPNKNVLTIDAGTCIKYNFTNSNNEYLGGAISPGFQMRFKAMNHYTSRLPLVKPTVIIPDLIGTNTTDSMLSGVVNGCLTEIEGTINLYKKQYPEILVLLTGGDSEYFAEQLKNSIFTHPNLVLEGLNTILNYNFGIK